MRLLHWEEHWKIIVAILVVIGIIGFAIFFAFRLAKEKPDFSSDSSTTSPAITATTSAGEVATTTKREGIFSRFFKKLGYDFSILSNRKPRPTPPPPRPRPAPPPRPAVVQAPPAPPSPGQGRPLPDGFTEADLSSYYGQITITRVSHPDLAVPSIANRSYAELALSVKMPQGVNAAITGWRIKARSRFTFIPKGNEVLHPFAGGNNDTVVVRNGDLVRIFSHAAPVTLNFRLNACTGYLQNFTPSIPKACPKIYENTAELYSVSGQCQDYIRTLGACSLTTVRPQIPPDDSVCIQILQRANYQTCYEEHRTDQNFLSREWRIWLGNSTQRQVDLFDPRHDRVLLFDQNGKLVDEYVY